jgi:hypothetical protein
VIFFIDDDCLMYDDYASVVMAVYDRDIDQRLAGVAGHEVQVIPGQDGGPSKGNAPMLAARALRAVLYRCHKFVNHFILMKTSLAQFYPYRGRYPKWELTADANVVRRVYPLSLFGANKATFRRSLLNETRFDDGLIRYAAAEDLDLCYRMSFRGALLFAHDAKIYHAHHPVERLNLRTVSLIRITNVGYLLQRNAPGDRRAQVGYVVKITRRVVAHALQDLLERNWTFPRVQGALAAFRPMIATFSLQGRDLVTWYQQFQERVYQLQRQDKT